jgi:hypothetical protein
MWPNQGLPHGTHLLAVGVSCVGSKICGADRIRTGDLPPIQSLRPFPLTIIPTFVPCLSTHIYLNLQSCNMDGGSGWGIAPARGRVFSYITVAMYCNRNARGFETLTYHYLYICAGI